MQQPLLLLGIVCLSLASGCLGFVTDEDIQTNLEVEVNEGLRIIETVYDQGERISSSTVTFDLDYSASTSDVSIETFGLTTDDGRSIEIDAKEKSTISLNFEHHGMYTISVYAIDSSGVTVKQSIVLIVEQIVIWTEENTGNPQSLFFDATPGNEGPSPSHFVLNSTITNPSPLLELNGRDVDIEWAVINVDGQCMGNREIVENGDAITWNTLHFTPLGLHEIEMTIHDGQDDISIEHIVAVRYDEQIMQ